MPVKEGGASANALATEFSVPSYINEELFAKSITDGLRVENVTIVEYNSSSSPNFETRSRLDELVDTYYRSFSATLRQLQYHTVPSLDQVRREIRRMEFFSLVSIVSVLPIVLMDKTDEVVADLENLTSGGATAEKAREIQYNGANYQRIVRPMLIEFNQRGLLDITQLAEQKRKIS